MKKFLSSTIGLAFSLTVFSCAPLAKTDLKSLNEDPEKYAGKHIVVTTNLKNVVEKPEDHLGKQIELKGYVQYDELQKLENWNFMIKDNEGRYLKCYESNYNVAAEIWTKMVVRQADRKGEQLTVMGRLEKGLVMELDWIEYGGQHIDTDVKTAADFPFPNLF